jgi:hypothetical protein
MPRAAVIAQAKSTSTTNPITAPLRFGFIPNCDST